MEIAKTSRRPLPAISEIVTTDMILITISIEKVFPEPLKNSIDHKPITTLAIKKQIQKLNLQSIQPLTTNSVSSIRAMKKVCLKAGQTDQLNPFQIKPTKALLEKGMLRSLVEIWIRE